MPFYSKYTWREWLILDAWIVVVAIAFAAHTGAIPEYPQICDIDACKPHYIIVYMAVYAAGFVDHYHDFFTTLSTIAIAAFTGTLWVSTNKQATIAIESIKLARDEFNSTHRPKIRVKHLWLKSEIWNGEKILVHLVIVNTGDTIAVVKAIKLIAHVAKPIHSLPADLLEGKPIFPVDERLTPGRTVIIPVMLDRTLTLAENAGLRLGRGEQRTKRLYCIGDIEYSDSAETKWMKTAFCRRWEFPIYPVRTFAIKGRFRIMKKYPDYDYED